MAEGLSPAEEGPAPAAPSAPGADPGAAPEPEPNHGQAAAAGETGVRPSLYAVEVPPAGRRRVYPVYPQLFIKLGFDLTLPAIGRRGDDMVLCFENGGEAVLRGFLGIAETHPTLHLLPSDGSLLPGDYLAEALTELGEAPALPSDDGLAAWAATPPAEASRPEPAQPEAAPPGPAEPGPAQPGPAEPEPVHAAPPQPPRAGTEPPQAAPGPVPTQPRPAPRSEPPDSEFPFEEILQDL